MTCQPVADTLRGVPVSTRRGEQLALGMPTDSAVAATSVWPLTARDQMLLAHAQIIGAIAENTERPLGPACEAAGMLRSMHVLKRRAGRS